jgi:hypothetical protein
MQKLTADNATEALVGRTIRDTRLDTRLVVTEVVPEQGGVVVAMLVVETSENLIKGEEVEIFVGPGVAAWSFNDYAIEA